MLPLDSYVRIVFSVSIVAWMDMAATIATCTIGTAHLTSTTTKTIALDTIGTTGSTG